MLTICNQQMIKGVIMVKILDCTLRDGANVVGTGFDGRLTKMIIEGLISSGIIMMEIGNANGVGATKANELAPLSDVGYLELIQPYLDVAEIGMFILAENATIKNIDLASRYGLKFLRVGANAGSTRNAYEAIYNIKEAGMKCKYSLMKSYVLKADRLAEEAKKLSEYGVDEITIMDSAGTMLPNQVAEYVRLLVNTIDIPVGFHGHNNLGLSVANALAAQKAGASVFDTGLLGMARSAGNCATELLIAIFQKNNLLKDINLYFLLDFLDDELIPAMGIYDYKPPVYPIDIVLGISGCHSSSIEMFKEISIEANVPLYKLIVEVSKIDRKTPNVNLLRKVANILLDKN